MMRPCRAMVMRTPCYCSWLIFLCFLPILSVKAQTYIFGQLTGSPINTSGWNLQGAAYVGNVTGSSEVILTNATIGQSGAIFFNQPINLSQCKTWIAEFDFRMNGGTMADGLAFCFLDVPPVGFVTGAGLGIPSSANGLKVCFDTYNNCSEPSSTMPKIQIRWGVGYTECSTQPTLYNSGGNLSFIRSPNYNRAKIEYNNGLIRVYVNNNLYLTGNQNFNFTGYFGFTASTGGFTDIHSIKNVVIYTNMPASQAGPDVTICSGGSATLGTNPATNTVYQWTPATGLSNAAISNPVVSIVNNTTSTQSYTYFVNSSFADVPGCVSRDTVVVNVLPQPAITIFASSVSVCSGATVNFTIGQVNAGNTPTYQWMVNGNPVGTNSISFSSATLADGDVVSCIMQATCGMATSNSITMSVTTPLPLSVSIQAGATSICKGETVVFTASSNTTSVNYQWKINGVNVGTNSNIYSSSSLTNGDVITCEVSTTLACTTPTALSAPVTIMVETPVQVDLGPNRGFCAGSSIMLDAGNYAQYAWNTGATSPTLTINNPGTYSVIAYAASGCPSYDTIDVFLFAAPVVNLGPPSPLCSGEQRILDAGNFSSYSWNNGSSARTLAVNAPGFYSVTVLDGNGCSGSGSTSVTSIVPNPVLFLPVDTSICSYGSVQINPVKTFSSYVWSTGETSPSIIVNQPGTYWLEVRDANNCRGKDSIVVVLKECQKGFYAPTAFSPNGDGKNDLYKPLLFGNIKSYQLKIFNRWGNLVFQTNDPTRGWDGSIQGLRQATGVFIFTCSYQFENESPRTERGKFVLIR
jgi:gliding motility-associated-like protein